MSLPGKLLLITNRSMASHPLPQVVAEALEAGCRWVLVREKDLPRAALRSLVEELLALARPYDARVLISVDAAVAAVCKAHGVHLPQAGSPAAARQRLGSGRSVGVSAHSLQQALVAAELGANYVTLSPIFASASKPGYGPALGVERLRAVAARLPIPVLALGGVTAANAGSCLAAGAAAVAVMGAVMRAPAPGQVTRELLAALS